jgi:hypothetical protein
VGSVVSATVPPVMQTGKACELSFLRDIPENADLETLASSVSVKNSFGLDLVVISTADNGYKFTKFGRNFVKIKLRKFKCEFVSSVNF